MRRQEVVHLRVIDNAEDDVPEVTDEFAASKNLDPPLRSTRATMATPAESAHSPDLSAGPVSGSGVPATPFQLDFVQVTMLTHWPDRSIVVAINRCSCKRQAAHKGLVRKLYFRSDVPSQTGIQAVTVYTGSILAHRRNHDSANMLLGSDSEQTNPAHKISIEAAL